MIPSTRLRIWLGLEKDNTQTVCVYNLVTDLFTQVTDLRSEVHIQNAALGRILAKLDPTFGQSELDLDSARKVESDELGDDIIKRLQAEQAVIDHYHYTPTQD